MFRISQSHKEIEWMNVWEKRTWDSFKRILSKKNFMSEKLSKTIKDNYQRQFIKKIKPLKTNIYKIF